MGQRRLRHVQPRRGLGNRAGFENRDQTFQRAQSWHSQILFSLIEIFAWRIIGCVDGMALAVAQRWQPLSHNAGSGEGNWLDLRFAAGS